MSQISFKIILIIPIFILLCLSLFVIFAYDIEMANGKLSIKSNISKQIKSNLIGQKKPNFYLTPLNHYETPQEKHLDVSNYKLVNFWASWCAPCRAEHKSLMSIRKNGYRIIGVNYKDNPLKKKGGPGPWGPGGVGGVCADRSPRKARAAICAASYRLRRLQKWGTPGKELFDHRNA